MDGNATTSGSSVSPRVSVIVPVYNTASFLADCLDSVLTQTMPDIEVICIDDGSTDQSPTILRGYAERDPRVRVETIPNSGLSAARNLGVSLAAGSYVCFLDSDDMLDSETLQHLYAVASRDNLDVLHFGIVAFCEDESLSAACENYREYYRTKGEYRGTYSGPALMAEMQKNGDFKSSACIQLYRTSFLREHGITFYDGILHEDNLYTFECALRAERVAFSPRVLYRRRVREDSIMTRPASILHFNGYYITYLEMTKLVSGMNLDPATASAADKVVSSMYRAARRTLALLPASEQRRATPVDDSALAAETLQKLVREISPAHQRLTALESRVRSIGGRAKRLLRRLLS